MSYSAPLTDQERADLVAYLDGELTGEAARALETKLSLNPQARAEAEGLKRAWEMLDFLPGAEPSASFTHRTLSRLAPVPAGAAPPVPAAQPWFLTNAVVAGWVFALALWALVGYAGYRHFVPRQPGDRELVRELRLIENKRYYDLVGDLEFLRQLDTPELFGDESGR